MNDNRKFPLFETLFIAFGEILVSAAVAGIYLIINKFSIAVVLGGLLGSLLVVLNFILLSVMVNRAIDKALEAKPEGELSDEELEEFSLSAAMSVKAAARLSYIIRIVSMVASLAVAFISGQFDVIATLVPFLALRPLIMAQELFKRKKAN